MDGIRLTVGHLFYDRHNISVGMFNRVVPHLPVLRNHFLQIRNNQLIELFTVEEGVHIKAIIGAQGKTIQQMASCIESCGKFQAVVQSFFAFLIQYLRFFIHLCGKIHHGITIGDRPGRIPVHHDIVFVPGFFPDRFKQPLGAV